MSVGDKKLEKQNMTTISTKLKHFLLAKHTTLNLNKQIKWNH